MGTRAIVAIEGVFVVANGGKRRARLKKATIITYHICSITSNTRIHSFVVFVQLRIGEICRCLKINGLAQGLGLLFFLELHKVDGF